MGALTCSFLPQRLEGFKATDQQMTTTSLFTREEGGSTVNHQAKGVFQVNLRTKNTQKIAEIKAESLTVNSNDGDTMVTKVVMGFELV